MNNITKKVEIGANISIIIIAILVCILVGQKMLFSSDDSKSGERPNVSQELLVTGTKFTLSDVDWSKQPKNVVLVLQKGCRFCTESGSFYRRVVEKAQRQQIRVLAVLPQGIEESKQYLTELGIVGVEVKQSSLSSVKVRGTPTVLITDNKGEIMNIWRGKLPSHKEDEVLSHL